MRWMVGCLGLSLLSACVYTDAAIVEPREVVVAPQHLKPQLGRDWRNVDVTETRVLKGHCNPFWAKFFDLIAFVDKDSGGH
jgi:hypothetical protein